MGEQLSNRSPETLQEVIATDAKINPGLSVALGEAEAEEAVAGTLPEADDPLDFEP